MALVLVIGLGAGATRSAFADDRTTAPAPASSADAHFQRGVGLFDSADYTGAAEEFRAAYATSPDFRVLYNIGQASQRARRYAAAREAFQRYLSEGESRVPAERRQRVEASLAELD